MSSIKVPKFSGEGFRPWFNDFQNCMLLLDADKNDAKQAKFFKVNLVEGSAAQHWFDTEVGEEARTKWSLLVPLLKARFDNSADERRNAFKLLSTERLEDRDVGQVASGEPKHVTWARSVAVASDRAGKDPDNNNAFLVLNNVGRHLRGIIITSGCLGSVAGICAKVQSLSPTEVETVKDLVRRDAENVEMRTKLALLERQFSGRGSMLQDRNVNVPLQPTYQQPQRWSEGNQNVAPEANIEPGPFPTTQDGHERYRRAVQGFYQKYGENAYASISRPFPLSPGTKPAGSNECFRCGHGSHLRPACTVNYTLPENEQRYRGSIMKQRRESQNAMSLSGSNTMQLGRPLRCLGVGNYEFAYLAALPISPCMSDNSPLPKTGSENGDGLYD